MVNEDEKDNLNANYFMVRARLPVFLSLQIAQIVDRREPTIQFLFHKRGIYTYQFDLN